MTIGIGRRRLLIQMMDDCPAAVDHHYPTAEAATDRELARLNALRSLDFDRMRWESTARLHGASLMR